MPERVKEKLVEIIQCSVGGCARHWAEVIAVGLIANGVTVRDKTEISDEFLEQLKNTPVTILQEEPTIEVVQEWISVKDRLPKEGIDVLIYNDEDRDHYIPYFTGFLDGGTWYSSYEIYEEANFMEFMHVTHWMPLPQPPKGE